MLGSLTGVSALVLICFAWNQAYAVSWHNPYTYILLIMGFLLLYAFFYTEWSVAKEPLVPIRTLSGETALVLAVIAAGWGSFGVWVFYQWQLLEVVRGYSALAAVAQNSPVALTGLIAALFTGFLISRIHITVVLTVAMVFFLVGQILIATTPVNQTYILGSDLCFHCHHAVGYGYEFPVRHGYSIELYGTCRSGSCFEFGQHGRELLHCTRTGDCGDHRTSGRL